MGTIPDMLSAARNQFAEKGAVVVPGGLGRLPAELYIQYSITVYYVLPAACFSECQKHAVGLAFQNKSSFTPYYEKFC